MRSISFLPCVVVALLLGAGPIPSQAHGAELTEKQAIDLIKAANGGTEMPGDVCVVRLSAADPREVIAALQPLFGQQGAILAFDANTGSLAVAGPKDMLQIMLAVIRQLDGVTASRKKAGPGKSSPVTLTIQGTGTIVIDDEGYHVQPAAIPMPITFGRSGRKVLVWMAAPKDAIVGNVVLRAFGRTWTAPMAARPMDVRPGYNTEIEVPTVRVPTVFSVTPADSPNLELGQLVAYPDRDVQWDKKITLYSCGAPSWFEQWAAAIGLPVKNIARADLPDAPKRILAEEKGKSLLILGGIDKNLFASTKINILVLDAAWFGEAAGPVSVAPAQMLDGLAELARQQWPHPLKFTSHRQPYLGVKNRWAWITDGTGLPLAEEIRFLTAEEMRLLPPATGKADVLDRKPELGDMARLIASYVPWQEQLGRNESADATLLALLTAVSNAMPRDCQWSPAEVVYPQRTDITPAARPVLSAIRSGRFWRRQDIPDAKPEYNPPINIIVDLRGAGPVSDDRFQNGAKGLNPDLQQPFTRVLILGDDKLLDEWEWLKLDREKKRIGRAGVQWLPDDELPPSKENQIRLMLKLTELGVSLAPPQEKEEEK